MKRIACLLLIAALLCACAGTQGAGTKAYGEDFAGRVVDAWREKGCLDGMAQYSDTDLLDYYGIDLDACKCGAGFADAVGYTTEAIVVVADEATAKEIETLLSDHVAAMQETFRSYDPEAYRIAQQAVLERDGGMVVMLISPDAQTMLGILHGVNP